MAVATILTYHRIVADGERAFFHDVERSRFARHIERIGERTTRAPDGGRLLPGRGPLVITFDDGTVDHLWASEYLAARDIRATFFIIAGRLGAAGHLSEEAVRAVAALGHRIGSHSISHRHVTSLTPAELLEELTASRRRLEGLADQPVDWFAPPGGVYSRGAVAAALRAGYRVVRTMDWGYADWPLVGQVPCLPVMSRYDLAMFDRLLDGDAPLWLHAAKNLVKRSIGPAFYTRLRNLGDRPSARRREDLPRAAATSDENPDYPLRTRRRCRTTLMFRHTMERERAFEQRHIAKQQQMYLDTDVLGKVADDPGYRKKVRIIEQALAGEMGWILDIGAGTCGEDECLATKGYKFICTDVNELALDLSRQRSKRFNRDNLKYIACDGERLPFKDNTISIVMFNESLHHLPSPATALQEACRALRPGGAVLLFEPYSYNPWRRISEFRDRFKGTIEKSFSIRSISKLCEGAGLKIVEIKRDTYVSTTKLTRLNAIHRAARIAYYKASEAMPNIFGMILLTATKGTAQIEKSKADFDLEELLRCPASKSRLRRVPGGYLAIDDPQRRFYPIKNGIPLLLTSDCELLSAEAFENLLSEEL